MALGMPQLARREYTELQKRLKKELDAEPCEETRALLSTPPLRSLRVRESQSAEQPAPTAGRDMLEPVGGAVPLGSRFYVVRRADCELDDAIGRQDSIVLINGPRQVGKTSLLARGLQRARENGASVALTHFQALNASHLRSADSLLLTFAEMICEQLDIPDPPANTWDLRRGGSLSLRRYLRRVVLPAIDGPLVWALDEVDRIFTSAYGSEIFGLFRSWHDERALDPAGPWSRLTLAIAYSTEAHLFITNLNQSPFNVGTRFELEDFTLAQVGDLNGRYGYPMRGEDELSRFYGLVSGHPYLVRRGLHEMAARGTSPAEFEERASSEHWILGDHLRRIRLLLAETEILADAVGQLLAGNGCITRDAFYRLRSAGVLSGETPSEARFRCRLYKDYLAQSPETAS